MRNRLPRLISSYSTLATGPLWTVAGHLGVGLMLALLFVAALYAGDTLTARVLREVGGVSVLAGLFLLHGVLFACASFATAGESRAGHGSGVAVAATILVGVRRSRPPAASRPAP